MKLSGVIARIRLIQILVIIGIIAIPVSLVLRIIYAHRFIDWENGLVESVGIPAYIYRITLGAGFFCILTARFVHEKRKRRKQKQSGYQLPGDPVSQSPFSPPSPTIEPLEPRRFL